MTANQDFSEKRLGYLYEVGAQGGIRRAADVLGVNPSAVSRQIAALERNLHMPLLEKRGRNVVLTEAGKVLTEHYLEAQKRREAVYNHLKDLSALRGGSVRIRIGQGMIADFVDHVLKKFATAYPEVFVDISTGDMDATLMLILKGEADMAVSFGPNVHAALKRRSFPRGPLCAVVHKAHALAAHATVAIEELSQQRLIGVSDSFGLQRHMNAMFHERGLMFSPAYRCNLLSTALTLSRAGLGVAFMTTQSLDTLADRDLVAIPIDHPIAQATQCHLLRSSDRRFSPAAEHLWQLLIKFFS